MTDTATMIKALRILANDIESGDGVANACVADAALMIENMSLQLEKANERVRDLERQKEILEYYNGDVNALVERFLPKFAIEKQLETAKKCAFGSYGWVLEHIKFLEEQLRKEQDND